MPTGVVPINSDLKRRRWIREGLIQAASKSFWTPYTGRTADAIIYQVNNENAASGHTVVFDYDGNLSGKAVKGKSPAYGLGETKRKFSDKLTVERYRLVVDNGDRFDGVDIGDLSITQHADSRRKLGDLFVRWKDQAIFDTLQGFYGGQDPTHRIEIDVSGGGFLSYTDLVNIERILRTGNGYVQPPFGNLTPATQRAPLQPFRTRDGRSMWLMVVDPFTAANLKSNMASGGILQLSQHADTRGDGNRVFRGLLGTIGQLVIVEAESFFGRSTGNGLEDTEVEIAGLRQYDLTNTAWSGESGFVNVEYSRNLILGAGAVQLAFGKMPDYKFQLSTDFGIKSESALEVWMECKKTELLLESGDAYNMAKVDGVTFGVVALDIKYVLGAPSWQISTFAAGTATTWPVGSTSWCSRLIRRMLPVIPMIGTSWPPWSGMCCSWLVSRSSRARRLLVSPPGCTRIRGRWGPTLWPPRLRRPSTRCPTVRTARRAPWCVGVTVSGWILTPRWMLILSSCSPMSSMSVRKTTMLALSRYDPECLP